jgi:hypothetical protein
MNMSVQSNNDPDSLMYNLSGYMSDDSEEEEEVTGWVPETKNPVQISI